MQSPQKIADFKGELQGEDIAWASPCQAGEELAQCGSYYLISIPYFWRYFNSWEQFLFKVGRLRQGRPCTARSAGVGGLVLRNAPCTTACVIHTSHFHDGRADQIYILFILLELITPLFPWLTEVPEMPKKKKTKSLFFKTKLCLFYKGRLWLSLTQINSD